MNSTDATPAEPGDARPGDPPPGDAPNDPPPTTADLIRQLTAATTRMWGMGTAPEASAAAGFPAFPVLPQVGALSASQVSAMMSTIRAQRQSIAALQSQLLAFDENLASLEKLLEPLRSWTASWASLERGLTPPEPVVGAGPV